MLGFDIPTFVFQIVNFLVLLAILTKFFYRPVLAVMQKRQEQIDARIADAEQRAQQADAEREQLARQSETATREAAELVNAARNEAAKARQRLLQDAKVEVANLIEEARKTAAAEEQAAFDRLGRRLSTSAVTIAGSLIRDAAGEAVHAGLVNRLLVNGFDLDHGAEPAPPAAAGADLAGVVVESAYPLDAVQLAGLREQAALALRCPPADLTLEVREQPALLAGVRVLAGAHVVDMSLAHLLDALAASEGGH